ncbi:MAG TPA: SurA N-terminal domain-containing protein [Thermodesulfobacteriota bacterium]
MRMAALALAAALPLGGCAGQGRGPAGLPPATGPTHLVDAAVAAVGLDTILLSEVRLGCDLNRVRELPPPVDPTTLGPCPPAEEQAVLDQLINQALILEDAVRFNIEVPTEAVARGIEQLEARLAGPDGLDRLLARYDLDRAALEERIAREVLLGRFLERRIGLLVFVSPDEIERYYPQNRDRFGGAPLETVEAEIRTYLSRVKYRDALAEYIESLRSSGDVRRLGDTAGAGGS